MQALSLSRARTNLGWGSPNGRVGSVDVWMTARKVALGWHVANDFLQFLVILCAGMIFTTSSHRFDMRKTWLFHLLGEGREPVEAA